ncbi:C-C chemokine receptor type 5-like [Actinia tenebrosa]|uniref:C-C chemokine receptor type 5-like n=1 Tax=Actinia tenebrosa TaxID=6105 RepID=A0A6P8HDJ0_ACTTE|nr:C-C chemokine receptor type 5-like [Actinia tenebrosa]
MMALENNFSLIFSSSNSSTDKARQKFIFSPIDRSEKIIFSLVMSLLCCFAIVANATILYYSKRQGRRQIRQRRGTFKRSLTDHFVQSLAWTDFLCAITIPAIFIGQLFTQMALKEWSCKLLRYLTIFFPTVTLANLMVIGVERYIAVFYPFFSITKGNAKKGIFIAWIFGGFVTLIPTATYKVIRQDLGADTYTLICKYDRRVLLYKSLIMGFTLIVYIIPSLVLVVTSIRIIRFLSQRKLFRKKNIRTSWRLKKTSMFVKLIFSYVIPYFLYVIYVIIYMATDGELKHYDDFVIRRCSALLSFSNTVVNPIIFYSNMGGLRKMLRDSRFRYYITGHFRGNVVVRKDNTDSSPCRAIEHKRQTPVATLHPMAWKNRSRRNGIGLGRTNVVIPMGNDVSVHYNTHSAQVTTSSYSKRQAKNS